MERGPGKELGGGTASWSHDGGLSSTTLSTEPISNASMLSNFGVLVTIGSCDSFSCSETSGRG